jgi:hypothetical protein
VTNAFAMLRLLPTTGQDKDAEILALRQQIAVLERPLNGKRVSFTSGDRAFLAALLHGLPKDALRRMRLLVRPTRSCAGTATWSPAGTPPNPDPIAEADPAPSAPSEPSSYAWPTKTPAGDIGACTANCSS